MDTVNLLGPLLICAFPLLGAIVALFIERKSPKVASFVTTGAIGASFVVALAIAFMGGFFNTSPAEVGKLHDDINTVPRVEAELYNELGDWPTDAAIAERMGIEEARVTAALQNQPKTWMEADRIEGESTISVYGIKLGIHIDHLAMAMLLMVTLASTLIHVFSMGYMHGDPRFGAFFRWIGFFTFSMLGLLISDNLLSLYICWELMGLSSYKLIGFFYHKESAQEACKKAFMTTRIGDVGMFLGILLIYATVGSVRYTDIFDAVANGTITDSIAMWASIGLFFGAVGKSAQFPLHVWL
ncbi:MAG: proton-conducting transporter transmembrane domain-containing protein, partial [Planctomycetota bacterium]